MGITPVSYTHLDVYKRQAEQWGLQLWHTDWNTYDMSVEALQVSLDNDTLRILPEQPAATMLDVVFDEEDDEYRTYNPLRCV